MWDQRYAAPDYIYGKEPNDFLAKVSGSLLPARVRCLAEGEGRNAAFLVCFWAFPERRRKPETERGVTSGAERWCGLSRENPEFGPPPG
ncbi:MAG: hypothetical protein RBR25_16745 [Trichloromonas sp.]|nr:hypothetical protein [Trichloromonas sp.]